MARIQGLLAELLPRWLAIALGIRRVVPIDGLWPPERTVQVEPLDTGGAFRAAWREQDPSADPKEPYGSESSSTGSDHGWSNCTMTSAALAIAYQQPPGHLAPWGGDMRHKQGDLSGGTDLYDARDAWASYGETLTIKSGAGWSAVRTAHDERRAVVIQGTGNVPGSESFDGGHACAIAPETHSDGRWLFGDPLASGWQWVEPSAIESWAERWQSSVAFAVGEKPPATPPPQPPPTTSPPCPDPGPEIRRAEGLGSEMAQDAAVVTWIAWIEAGAAAPADRWDAGAWGPVPADSVARFKETRCDQSRWSRGPLPDPVAAAYTALATVGSWDGSAWREATWAM